MLRNRGGRILLLLILSLFIATGAGANQDHEKYWHSIQLANTIYQVTVDGNSILLGVDGGLLKSSIANPQLRRFSSFHIDRQDIHVYAIFRDKLNRVWLGTSQGILCFDGANKPVDIRGLAERLGQQPVRAIVQDHQGTLWFGTWGGGVFSLTAQGEIKHYNRSNSQLPADSINAIAADRQGVWLATDGGGVAYLGQEGKWSIYNSSNTLMPVNHVTQVAVNSQGAVGLATFHGLVWRTAAGEWQQSNSLKGLAAMPAYSVAARGNAFWFGTEGGVVLLEGEKHQLYPWGDGVFKEGMAKNLAVAPNNKLVVSVYGQGLAVLDTGTKGWQQASFSLETLLNNLLPGAGAQVAAQLEGRQLSWEQRMLKQDEYRFMLDDLTLQLTCYGEDQLGNTYLGTLGKGVVKVDSKGNSQSLQNAQGLPGSNVRSLALDSRGWLWVLTEQGVFYSQGGTAWLKAAGLAEAIGGRELVGLGADNRGNVLFLGEGLLTVHHPEGLKQDIKDFVWLPEASGQIAILYKGRYLKLDVPPIIESNRTLVPMRAIFEAMGAQVDWNEAEQQVTAVLGDKNIQLKVNSKVANVNGVEKALDVPARAVQNRTMVPLRFVGESLGLKVDWDGATRTVVIQEQGR